MKLYDFRWRGCSGGQGRARRAAAALVPQPQLAGQPGARPSGGLSPLFGSFSRLQGQSSASGCPAQEARKGRDSLPPRRLQAVPSLQCQPHQGSHQRQLLRQVQQEEAAAGQGWAGRSRHEPRGQGAAQEEGVQGGRRLRRVFHRYRQVAADASFVLGLDQSHR